MINFILKKIIGTKNERELKRIMPIMARVNEFEPGIKVLNDDALKAKTPEFKQRIANGESLDSLLPEAFAVMREASKRVLEMRHFDSQLVGGIVLHEGKISEMKTGEGKTLVATLPVYLNALTGKGVHVVTVNDYLARRDSEWMGRVYKFLGLSVGNILHGLQDFERQQSYHSDVTYGTNNEFGFDYLRDNMKFNVSQFVQRPLNYAIVDEVDSILIDEARTPLIISGPAEDSTQLYFTVNQMVPFFKKEEDYTVDEKSRAVVLTDSGVAKAEKRLGVDNLFDPRNINYLHHVNQALKAHVLYKRDVDYVVKDGEIVIVDEFTGRLMPGRRWSDGIHQAVEAKEGVRIENENQTLATISFQNYFRMYNKLSGMTGTADTEAAEFAKIYNLEVVVIPTNKPMVREDFSDVIYKTEREKFKAVVQDIRDLHEKGQPVLVGTISIEKSERVSEMLKRFGVFHHVLNAKQHEREAEIIAQAGRKGGVTISTNMAGRGVDILLGGNPEYLARAKVGRDATEEEYRAALQSFREQCAAEKEEVLKNGGLHIMGTERHESRRIDNQLRGRAGRQGDPGSSRFYLSLEDDLMRIFGGERIKGMMNRIGMEEDEVIEHRLLSRAIAGAQKKVEDQNFSIRKNLIEYDDVMNQQRQTVYKRRAEIIGSESSKDLVFDMVDQLAGIAVDEFVPSLLDEDFDPKSFQDKVREFFDMTFDIKAMPPEEQKREVIGERLYEQAVAAYEAKEKLYGPDVMHHVERYILLQTLDALWKDHLLQMDHLREGIGLRGYGQKDPLLEYKKEGFSMFRNMMDQFSIDSVQKLFRVQVKTDQVAESTDLAAARKRQTVTESHGGASAFAANSSDDMQTANAPLAPSRVKTGTVVHQGPKVGRNDPCPCGSGKKHKKCCGLTA